MSIDQVTSRDVTHFTITGDAFTRIARGFMLDDEPAKAWRFVCEGLLGDGGGMSVAATILDGKHKLVGNEDDLVVVRDTGSERYVKDTRYIYAGRFRSAGRWWRPRAYVADYGPDDMRERRLEIGGGDGGPTSVRVPSTYSGRDKRSQGSKRSEFYAAIGERLFDKAVYVVDYIERDVIFEPCGEPPHWWPTIKSPQEAVDDFVAAGRKLDVDGWSVRFAEEERADVKRRKASRESAKAIAKLAEERADEDRRAELEAIAWAAKIEEIRLRVVTIAGDDTFPLTLSDGRVLTVARAPFMRWALARTSLKHLAPPWTPQSMSGMKLPCDDPCHTDWLIGAGLQPRDAYDEAVSRAATREAWALQKALGYANAAVVVDAGDVCGTVGNEVVVLPNLGVEHVGAIANAKAIIAEVGGRLAHLALVATERNMTIMLVEDAVRRYPIGRVVTLSPSRGQIETDIERF